MHKRDECVRQAKAKILDPIGRLSFGEQCVR